MLDEMANYATIILALAMINVVWQLEKASKLLTELSAKYQEQLKYFSNYKPSELGTVAMEVVTNIERYRSLLEVMKKSNDLEFYNENRKIFNMYNHLFKLFDRDDE